jgi:homoserine dehydrogenase
LKLAIIGYGNVGRALARLVRNERREYPFRITGIHTLRHGTATAPEGLPVEPEFGPRAPDIDAFFEAARADTAIELTTLNPLIGEPAIGHIRAAFARGMDVVTANKGPIAHCYAALCHEAAAAGVRFRFEATVMDGAPVFNLWRYNMPGVKVLGFTGALNSTSKIVVETMERGGSFEDGLRVARERGITEGDGSYDVEGWDSACKTAALANVLLDARTSPQQVSTRYHPADAGTRSRPGDSEQDGAAHQPRPPKRRRCIVARPRRGSEPRRHPGLGARDFEHHPVSHRPDGHVRDGLDRSGRGTDGLRRLQRPGELIETAARRKEYSSRITPASSYRFLLELPKP